MPMSRVIITSTSTYGIRIIAIIIHARTHITYNYIHILQYTYIYLTGRVRRAVAVENIDAREACAGYCGRQHAGVVELPRYDALLGAEGAVRRLLAVGVPEDGTHGHCHL